MPMQIVDNVSRRIFHGVRAVHMRGRRIAVLSGDGRILVPGEGAGVPVNTAPVLAPIPALSATVGKPFSYTAAGSDAEGPVVWGWTGLPAGIIANGPVITGSAEAAGTANITVSLTDAGGLSVSRSTALTVTAAADIAPTVTAAPTIAGAATAGSVLTVEPGSASGSPAPAAQFQWRRGNADIAGATGRTYTLVAADAGQAITARVTWTNSAGTAQAVSNAITGAAKVALDYDRGALIYYEKGMPITGTDAVVSGVATRGTAGVTLAAVGTGADITNSAAGLAFAAGKSLSRTGLSGLPMGDGIFVVARITLNAAPASGTQEILAGAGKYPRILSLAPGTALTVQAVADSNTSLSVGALSYPARLVVGGELDDVANTLRALALDGTISSLPIALTDPSATAFGVMKNVNGTLERLAIVARPEGGAWPLSFDSVVADFRTA